MENINKLINPRFLAVDSHWREYDKEKAPMSWGIPSAGLAYVIASVKDRGGGGKK